MTDVAFSTLAVRVSPSVPGCPTATITAAVRDSARKTCERTLAYRYTPATMLLTPSTFEYAYDVPENTEVHAIVAMTVNDTVLRPLTLEQAINKYPQWGAAGTEGTPADVTQVTVDKYVVLPPPNDQADYTVRMFLALKPKTTATGMEEVALGELTDTIVHGALERLLVLPNVPWADRELAAYHAKQYLFHTSERRARTNLGNQRAALTVRAVPFG